MRVSALLTAVCMFALASSIGPARAADFTWNGGGADDNWTTGANWGGTAPAGVSSDSLFFGGTTRLTPVVDSLDPWTVNKIIFNSGAGAFGITGNPITFGGTGGEVMRNNSAATQTIVNDLNWKGQVTAQSGDIVLNGDITLNGGMLVRGSNDVTLAGKISGGNGISRTDPGVLTLTNDANDFTGNVSVSHGVLSVGSIADAGEACALGAGTTINLGQGTWGPSDTGTLRYTGPSASTNRTITMTSNDVYRNGAEPGLSGRPTIEVTDPNSTLTFNGDFQYAPGSFAGIAWFLKGDGNGVINGNITTTDAGVTKQGSGTWTLAGNNAYNGPTTVSGGTLALGVDNTLPATTDVLLNGGTLNVNSKNQEVHSLTLASGSGGLSGANSGGKWLSLSSTDDALVWTAGKGITARIMLTGASGGNIVQSGFSGSVSYGGTLDLGGVDRVFDIGNTSGGSDLFFNGVITNGGVIKRGEGTLKYGGNNTYAGITDIQEGVVFLQFSGAGILDTAPVRVSGGTLQVDSGVGIETIGDFTLAAGAATGSGTVAAASYDLQDGVVSVMLAGTGPLQKTTGGSVTLSAANPFAGPTTVAQGTLMLAGAGSLANSPTIDVAEGAVLDVSGVSGGTYALTAGQLLHGNGTVQGNLDVGLGATISAGDSPGHLTHDGNYEQTGTMLVEISGLAQGQNPGYDWIEVTGTGTSALIDGLVDVRLLDGFVPQTGDVFDVLTAGTVTLGPEFQIEASQAPLAPAQFWDYRVTGDAGASQALELFVGVPEPSSLVLLALGLLVLLGLARRRW